MATKPPTGGLALKMPLKVSLPTKHAGFGPLSMPAKLAPSPAVVVSSSEGSAQIVSTPSQPLELWSSSADASKSPGMQPPTPSVEQAATPGLSPGTALWSKVAVQSADALPQTLSSSHGVSRNWASVVTPELAAKAERVANTISENGIRMVVWDFDGTIISQHSHGRVQDIQLDLMMESVSHDFLALFESLQATSVVQAVATFSDASYHGDGQADGIAGERLVRTVLDHWLGSVSASLHIVAAFPGAYQKEKAWKNAGLSGPMPQNKTWHLDTLISRKTSITRNEVLLIDDSDKCYKGALEDGFQAVKAGRGPKDPQKQDVSAVQGDDENVTDALASLQIGSHQGFDCFCMEDFDGWQKSTIDADFN